MHVCMQLGSLLSSLRLRVVGIGRWWSCGNGSRVDTAVFFFNGTQDGAQHEDERAPLAVLFS